MGIGIGGHEIIAIGMAQAVTAKEKPKVIPSRHKWRVEPGSEKSPQSVANRLRGKGFSGVVNGWRVIGKQVNFLKSRLPQKVLPHQFRIPPRVLEFRQVIVLVYANTNCPVFSHD